MAHPHPPRLYTSRLTSPAMTLLLNCNLPRDSMSQLTPSALSNPSGAIQMLAPAREQLPLPLSRFVVAVARNRYNHCGFNHIENALSPERRRLTDTLRYSDLPRVAAL